MNPKNQVKVTADVTRNVLEMAFTGRISAGVMAPSEAELAGALLALKPGFSLLTDFTEMTAMGLDCVPYFDRVMDAIRDRGVALIVRVIPDRRKDIGLGIISLFHYPPAMRIVTTDSREEAERVLA